MKRSHSDSLLGCLLGTAVGDALGLPAERLSRKRVAALGLGKNHRFLFGRGMVSDDTEHSLMLAAALAAHRGDIARVQRAFAWKLRWWFLALPAGVGLSTAKAVIRLWLGFPASRAGVKSAGNGAAMRSAVVGVVFREDEVMRHAMALAACRVTHRGPHAEESALMVADAAAMAANGVGEETALSTLEPLIQSEEMRMRFVFLKKSLKEADSVGDYAQSIGCEQGVSGYAPNTVAVALYAWLRHRGDFGEAVRSVIACGGDADTVAAITGAICGAETGAAGIPHPWIAGIFEWPRSVPYVHRLANTLANHEGRLPSLFWPAIPLRNSLFLMVVILHGFRRMLPPY